jgi:hypothetical protein
MSFLKKLLAARLHRAPTRAQWFANIQNIERLREIVTDPVFIAASNHILAERRIRESDVFNHPDLLPLRAAHAAGHSLFLLDLESLAKTQAPIAEQLGEWEHLELEADD